MDLNIPKFLSKHLEFGVVQGGDGTIYTLVSIKGLKCVVSYSPAADTYAMVLQDTVVTMTRNSAEILTLLKFLETENVELIFGNDHPKFAVAKDHVTSNDVKYVQQLIIKPGEKVTSEDEIRAMITEIRWKNRICNHCMDKSNILKLFFCDKCYLVQYCSKECKEKDLDIHRKRCCDPDGPLDDGPQQFAVVERV
ncbi:Hypothetical protein HVR_LOCUS979 [uncultured virus]|nr:Hypothetical protein HVR_LOCUS979 [uncultured virus]